MTSRPLCKYRAVINCKLRMIILMSLRGAIQIKVDRKNHVMHCYLYCSILYGKICTQIQIETIQAYLGTTSLRNCASLVQEASVRRTNGGESACWSRPIYLEVWIGGVAGIISLAYFPCFSNGCLLIWKISQMQLDHYCGNKSPKGTRKHCHNLEN
jgi:hypothetical protein